MTSQQAVEPNWDDQPSEFLSLDQLLHEEPEVKGDPLVLSDSRIGADKRQNELMKRIDHLKSRAEMSVVETFRHMKVQKAITQHMQPTMLALFRIEVILDSIATHKEADLTRQAVEDALDDLENQLTKGEQSLDALIRRQVTPDQLRDNPVRFTNPLKMSFTITCQQSRRVLNLLAQLDRVLVKSSILDMFGITDAASTKRAARKWVASVITTMRSLVNMGRNVMRAQYVKRANEMEVVAKEMNFDKESIEEAKAAAQEDETKGRAPSQKANAKAAKSRREEQDRHVMSQRLEQESHGKDEVTTESKVESSKKDDQPPHSDPKQTEPSGRLDKHQAQTG